MRLPKYQLKAESSLMVFEFTSLGPKGKIAKLVKYSETNLKDMYNLAFGDKDIKTGHINDTIISNNGDSDMVLATVVSEPVSTAGGGASTGGGELKPSGFPACAISVGGASVGGGSEAKLSNSFVGGA